MAASKKEFSIANALNSISKSNLRGAASDINLRELIVDYFGGDNDVDSSSDSDSDCESISVDVHAEQVHDESVHDDESDNADCPLVSVNEVADLMPEKSVSDTVCDSELDEIERIKRFQCNCKHYNLQPCYGQFSPEFILKRRMEMNELSEGNY